MTKTNNLPTILFSSFMLVTFLVGYDIAHTPKEAFKIDVAHAETIVEATPVPTAIPIPTDIVGYIEYKFGDRAIDAFTVLQGTGTGTCAENRTLNPEAINRNTDWGGVGADRGYWQINDVYHPAVSDSCAKDVKCSTDYAFKLFTARGNNFSAWTCGRQYGI